MSAPRLETDPTLRKLVNVLGAERAQTLTHEILIRIGRPSLQTADDRYQFATELMKQGGVLEAIGRAVKIQAILLGAKEA